MIAHLIAVALATSAQSEWQTLFDGKSLDGWTAKIKGYELGNNFGETFRVKDGAICVEYDQYGGKFNGRFGHLFYKTEYSNYVLRLEYRFVGSQLPDGPGWAYKNSGVMIHGQDPRTMGKDQDFPVSAEVQLLGGDAEGERHTGNLCTPGTNVVMGGKLVLQHCFDSTSPTYRGDRWVELEIEVRGHGTIIHRIEGEEVIRYEQVQLDERDSDAKRLIKDGKLAISGGTISLQSESHPVQFRNIRLRPL